jgi:hypothetical protein
MSVSNYLFGLFDPSCPVHVSKQIELKEVLLVAGEPVDIFLHVRKRTWELRVIELLCKLSRMKCVDVKALLVEAWRCLPAKNRLEGPTPVRWYDGPAGMVELETELFLQKTVEAEGSPFEGRAAEPERDGAALSKRRLPLVIMVRVVEVVITLASGKPGFISLFELCNLRQYDRDLCVATIK